MNLLGIKMGRYSLTIIFIDVGVYTFGSPGGSTAELLVNIAAGETVYVRTSSEIPPGGLTEAAVGWDKKHLDVVEKKYWESRE